MATEILDPSNYSSDPEALLDYSLDEVQTISDHFEPLLLKKGCDVTKIEKEWIKAKQDIKNIIRRSSFSPLWKKMLLEKSDMDEDRGPYDAAVEKLKGNLGSVCVLSQDELLALHEAEEKRLESDLNMTPKAADDFRWLCFDIASRRDEEKDKLDYLELGRKAIEYEQNKVKAGSQDGVNCSETLPLGNLSIKGDPIKDLIKTLNPKLEGDLGALMTLTEEEYQDLLKDDCALLKELNIPKQSVEDAARFCKEQQASLKKMRELVKFYKEDRRLLEVS